MGGFPLIFLVWSQLKKILIIFSCLNLFYPTFFTLQFFFPKKKCPHNIFLTKNCHHKKFVLTIFFLPNCFLTFFCITLKNLHLLSFQTNFYFISLISSQIFSQIFVSLLLPLSLLLLPSLQLFLSIKCCSCTHAKVTFSQTLPTDRPTNKTTRLLELLWAAKSMTHVTNVKSQSHRPSPC